ncbi:MAG: hypothetical protein LIP01_11720 [Tannerellaceae bacterium]|nr:hypothetical protein [Tannerellaceae bacterium]
MIQGSTNLYAQYDPLNVSKSMEFEGGGTKQVYYADSKTYMPNRELTPLTLQPVIIISDPDGIIPTGDKAGSLSAVRWFVGSTDSGNQITSLNTDYILGKNGSLIVNKNVPHESPVTLIFEGEFYDSRRMSSISIDMTVLLSTTSNAETAAGPSLTIDRPRAWRFNPLKGMGNQFVSCQLFLQEEEVPDTNARYWWYVVEKGKERLIGSDELDFFYVSGQNTKTLTVNPEFLKEKLFRCRAEYYEGTAPTSPTDTAAEVNTKFIRRFPKSLYVKPNVLTGSIILAATKTVKAEAIVGTKGGVVTDPEKFFHIRWLLNSWAAGSTMVQIGRGKSLSVDRSTIVSKSDRPELFVEINAHEPYMALTDKDGDILTDENGNVLVGF